MLVVHIYHLSRLHSDSHANLKYDYTDGQLPELIQVIIKNKVAVFVCAIGVPPKWVVDQLHAAGIPVMKYVLNILLLENVHPLLYFYSVLLGTQRHATRFVTRH